MLGVFASPLSLYACWRMLAVARAAYDHVIAAARTSMTPVDHELVGAKATLARYFAEDQGVMTDVLEVQA